MSLATISFVIPVLNEASVIGPLLEKLASDFPDSQRVVVDGGSSDGTVMAARLAGSRLLSSAPGRAVQMNAGARIASGAYIFFLHADTLPTITAAQLQECLAGGPQWGFFRVRLSGSSWMFRTIERAMNLRSRVSGIATGDQMIFIRRELFEQTGGFAAIPLMEDIEYCKRLRREAPPLVISQAVETSSRRWEQRGVVSTIVRMWSLRLAYFLGVSPRCLREHYRAH